MAGMSMAGTALPSATPDILWSIGMDWEISGPMNIISIANRLIQLARALADGVEGVRLALRAFIQSMRMLGGLFLRGRLLEHLYLHHEITGLGKVQRHGKVLAGL